MKENCPLIKDVAAINLIDSLEKAITELGTPIVLHHVLNAIELLDYRNDSSAFAICGTVNKPHSENNQSIVYYSNKKGRVKGIEKYLKSLEVEK